MGTLHKNYIAGEWAAGESEIENRNPSDYPIWSGFMRKPQPINLKPHWIRQQRPNLNGKVMGSNANMQF